MQSKELKCRDLYEGLKEWRISRRKIDNWKVKPYGSTCIFVHFTEQIDCQIYQRLNGRSKSYAGNDIFVNIQEIKRSHTLWQKAASSIYFFCPVCLCCSTASRPLHNSKGGQKTRFAKDARDWPLLNMAQGQWAISIMLFMPEGCWSKPHRELWRGLVSRNLPKFPMRF